MEKKNTPLLIAQNGKLNSKQWLLDDEIIIGRDADCDLVIDDRQVSRRHARIYQTSEGVFLEDLNSKNGSYINHKKIEGSVPINEGDVIQIALIQEFLFISSDATIPLSEEQVYRIVFIDKKNNVVWVGDKKIDPPLSLQQYMLLVCLYEHTGSIVSRMDIVAQVWADSSGAGISNEAIDALVRRVRNRLAEFDADTDFIETVRGYGFRFQNPVRK
jgi:pSer/pThr/pTyr-binding forkhead associated (FHA) protein